MSHIPCPSYPPEFNHLNIKITKKKNQTIGYSTTLRLRDKIFNLSQNKTIE
jgi:hypothetical protein